jgi:uncharacterized protein
LNSYFFDSSALIKRFTRETGTAWILRLFKPSSGNTIFIAQITGVEVVAGLIRKTRTGSLSLAEANKAIARFERSLSGRYAFVEVDAVLLDEARQLVRRYGLRGYDAVQLAAALEVNNRRQRHGLSPLTFVSADIELNNAALAEGLLVDNPNNHP